MQYKFFSIPARDSSLAEDELNVFLRSVRVLNISSQFAIIGNSPTWFFVVEYLPGSSDRDSQTQKGSRRRVDYREVLAPQDFVLFSKLRDWRKEEAAKDAVPVYALFTNDQLAKIATDRITSKSGLLDVDGIGDAKVNKYGDQVVDIIKCNSHILEDKKQ